MEFLTPDQLQDQQVLIQGKKITIGKKINLTQFPNRYRQTNKRGSIKEFSSNSRRRLKQLIAIQETDNCLFITLTSKENFEFNKVRAFLKRLFNVIGNKPVIWRKEYQDRGVVHYHLLVLNTKRWITAKWITRVWSEIIGSYSSTDIKLVQKDRIGIYISKDFVKIKQSKSKSENDQGYIYCSHITGGRFWGVENRKYMKICKIRKLTCKDLDQRIVNYALRLIAWLKQNNYSFNRITFVWWGYPKAGTPRYEGGLP